MYLCQISLQIMLLPILSFLLLLNSLIFLSFFGFLRNAGTWIATCVYFFPWISWFPDLFSRLPVSTRLQNMRQYFYGDWKTLENSRQFTNPYSSLEWILSKNFFFQGEGFQVWTALSLFTVNAPWLCQLPSVDMSLPNRHAHVRFGPIVRRVKNP